MIFTREQLLDHVQAMRTQSLFLETNKTKTPAIMTLGSQDREIDGVVYLSLRKLYLEANDPTEYTVANHVFGSWKHWTALFENKRIMSYINDYRIELEVKIKSQAVMNLINTAKTETVKGTAAAKYVAEHGWNKRKAGAPSKQEVKRGIKEAVSAQDDVQDAFDRLGLNTNETVN